MAIVQRITANEMPDIMALMTTDRVRELSENIRRESEMRLNNMFGSYGYNHSNERAMFLNIFDRQNEEVKRIIDISLSNVFMDDRIVLIDNETKLMKGVPKAMEIALLTSPMIRKALENDEIYGFGLHPHDLPDRDVVGRLINNGITDDNGHGMAYITSDDPVFSIADLDNIEDTRNFMETLLENGIDPTDYPSRVGKIK